MLDQLGKIIDSIYARIVSARAPNKRLIFVVGNGIRQVSNILNDDQVKVLASKRNYIPGTVAYREFKWRLFEYARYHTANSLPSRAHCYIQRLIADYACSDLITTNYDLFFDSIWRKFPSLAVATNPVAADHEYLWDGYYSWRKRSRRPRRYWKIHGSLSHGVFRSKKPYPTSYMLVGLPRCAIGTNQPNIAAAYGLDTTSPFLGYEALEFPGTNFPDHNRLDATFEPFIDWTYGNDRTLFTREIAEAKKVLRNTRSTAAIVLIGFRGYHNPSNPHDPWNEELVPVLQDLIKSGFDKIFMAVHQNQAAKLGDSTSQFMTERFSAGRGVSFADAGAFMEELVMKHTSHFPYLLVDAEFEKWANYYYLTTPERAHV
jgi:hypothetical protein